MKSNLIFNVSSSCNMNCSYCYRKLESFYTLKNMYDKYSKSKNILDILKSSDIDSIVFSGGEPSIFYSLNNLILIFLPYKNITIITNALKILSLDEEIINNINIIASLDGSYDVSKNSRNINYNEYVNVLNNINYYKSSAKSLSINSVITKYNICCANYMPFEIFGESLSYNFIIPSRLFTPTDLSLSQRDLKKAKNLIYNYIKKYNYKLNCNIGLIDKSIFISNYKGIISNMLTIEYKLETNKFYLFDSKYDFLNLALDNFDNKCKCIEEKMLNYLENKDNKYEFEPYGLAEMLMFENEI